MASFAYSFCIALLHSFWQTALLALVYYVFTWLFGKLSPQANRNLLLVSLFAQILVFTATFFISYFDGGYNFLDITLPNIGVYLPNNSNYETLYLFLFMMYSICVIYKIGKSYYNWVLFKKQITAGFIKPPVDVRLFTNAKAIHLGIKKQVSVWYSHIIDSPITYGFFKPIILLPVSLANNITLQQTETIILHELAHIKANDYAINWFVTITETLFFFNPFVVLLCKKLKLQRELHCDVTVLQHNYSPITYAETLLLAAKQQHVGFSLGAVSNKQQLLKRITFFTNPYNYQKSKNPFGIVVLLLLGTIIFFITLSATVTVSKKTNLLSNEILVMPLIGTDVELMSYQPTLSSYIKENKQSKIITQINEHRIKQSNTPKIANKAKDNHNTIIEEKLLYPSYIMPVAEREIIDESRQIIIEEEQSGNKPAVMMIYKATNINGEWVFEPQMIITKSLQDTAKAKRDSTLPINKDDLEQ